MPTEREWLAAHGIRPRKRLGQNFLLDLRIPELMVERAGWARESAVLEIGAGAGVLTQALIAAGHPVLAVERDPALIALLRERFAAELEEQRLELWEGDLLQLPLEALEQTTSQGMNPGGPRWVAGNLPYALTTPILLWIFERRALFQGAVLMMQREMGERILAQPGTKAYGSLTVWTRAHGVPHSLLRVGRSAFWPRPGVESIVLELTLPDPPPFAGDRKKLERVLRAAFGQRRKTLENSLSHGLSLSKEESRQLLLSAACDPGARAETLSLSQFAALADSLP